MWEKQGTGDGVYSRHWVGDFPVPLAKARRKENLALLPEGMENKPGRFLKTSL